MRQGVKLFAIALAVVGLFTVLSVYMDYNGNAALSAGESSHNVLVASGDAAPAHLSPELKKIIQDEIVAELNQIDLTPPAKSDEGKHSAKTANLEQCMTLWQEKEAYHVDRVQQRKDHAELWGGGGQIEAFLPEQQVEMVLRIGNMSLGGKYMVNPAHEYEDQEKCLVYAMGSAADLSFEREFIHATQGKCEVHFFDEGLSEDTTRDGVYLHRLDWSQTPTILQLLEKSGHQGRALDVLKFDFGGSYKEYDFMPQTFNDIRDGKLKIDIISAKLHNMDDQHTRQFRDFFTQADSADMRLYAKDPSLPDCGGWQCNDWAWISGKEAFRAHVLYRCPTFYTNWQKLYNQHASPVNNN